MKAIFFTTLFLATSVSSADMIAKHTKTLEQGSYSLSDDLEAPQEVDPIVKKNNCSAFSKFAKSSFTARQKGADAEAMFNIIDSENPEAKKIMGLIIKDSFNYPILYSGNEISRHASDYSNRFFLDCML